MPAASGANYYSARGAEPSCRACGANQGRACDAKPICRASGANQRCAAPAAPNQPATPAARTKAALSAPGDGEFSVGLPLPTPPPPSASFDAVRDESCVHEQGISALVDKFTTLSYSRPESMVGLAAVQALDRWLKHGIELRGGRDEKGFLFLYELMRGDLLFKLLPSDSEHTLGAMLLRSLPPSDFQVTS